MSAPKNPIDPKKAADFAKRLNKSGPGAAIGIAAIAGALYGLSHSIYTGE